MSYKKFVQYWEDGRKNKEEYRFEVGNVAAQFTFFLLEKLELDKNLNNPILKLFPLSEKDNEKIRTTFYAPYACVEFMEKGWCSFGLSFLIQINENTWPKNNFVYSVYIKRVDNTWKIKLLENGPERTVREENNKLGFDELWNDFENIFKAQTIDGLANWLGGN